MEITASWSDVWSISKFLRSFLFFSIIFSFLFIFFGLGYLPVLFLVQHEGIAVAVGLVLMFVFIAPFVLTLKGIKIPYYSAFMGYIERLMGDKLLQASDRVLTIDENLSFAYSNIKDAYYYFECKKYIDSETNTTYSTYHACLELVFDYTNETVAALLKYIPKKYRKKYVELKDPLPSFRLILQCMVYKENVPKKCYKALQQDYPTLVLYGNSKQTFLTYITQQIKPLVAIVNKKPSRYFIDNKKTPYKADFSNFFLPLSADKDKEEQ